MLFVDRETNSLWSQLHGQAVSGPMKGTPLRVLPSLQTTWKFWRERHPDTRVMVVARQPGRPYLYRNRPPGSSSPRKRSSIHDTSALGLGVVVGGEAIFFPLRELDRTRTPLKLKLGGKPLTLYYHKEGLTAWVEDERGNLVPSVLAYQAGWKAFNPGSRVYRAQPSDR